MSSQIDILIQALEKQDFSFLENFINTIDSTQIESLVSNFDKLYTFISNKVGNVEVSNADKDKYKIFLTNICTKITHILLENFQDQNFENIKKLYINDFSLREQLSISIFEKFLTSFDNPSNTSQEQKKKTLLSLLSIIFEAENEKDFQRKIASKIIANEALCWFIVKALTVFDKNDNDPKLAVIKERCSYLRGLNDKTGRRIFNELAAWGVEFLYSSVNINGISKPISDTALSEINYKMRSALRRPGQRISTLGSQIDALRSITTPNNEIFALDSQVPSRENNAFSKQYRMKVATFLLTYPSSKNFDKIKELYDKNFSSIKEEFSPEMLIKFLKKLTTLQLSEVLTWKILDKPEFFETVSEFLTTRLIIEKFASIKHSAGDFIRFTEYENKNIKSAREISQERVFLSTLKEQYKSLYKKILQNLFTFTLTRKDSADSTISNKYCLSEMGFKLFEEIDPEIFIESLQQSSTVQKNSPIIFNFLLSKKFNSGEEALNYYQPIIISAQASPALVAACFARLTWSKSISVDFFFNHIKPLIALIINESRLKNVLPEIVERFIQGNLSIFGDGKSISRERLDLDKRVELFKEILNNPAIDSDCKEKIMKKSSWCNSDVIEKIYTSDIELFRTAAFPETSHFPITYEEKIKFYKKLRENYCGLAFSFFKDHIIFPAIEEINNQQKISENDIHLLFSTNEAGLLEKLEDNKFFTKWNFSTLTTQEYSLLFNYCINNISSWTDDNILNLKEVLLGMLSIILDKDNPSPFEENLSFFKRKTSAEIVEDKELCWSVAKALTAFDKDDKDPRLAIIKERCSYLRGVKNKSGERVFNDMAAYIEYKNPTAIENTVLSAINYQMRSSWNRPGQCFSRLGEQLNHWKGMSTQASENISLNSPSPSSNEIQQMKKNISPSIREAMNSMFFERRTVISSTTDLTSEVKIEDNRP